MKKSAILVLLLWGVVQINAQSLAHQREATFGKGANLSNWLEAYWMGAGWPEPGKYQKQDLQAMKDAGMSTIRLPFCFALITDTIPPFQVDFSSSGIAWLDSVIAWTADLELNLIIDNQHGWDITNANYADKIPPMTSMWRQVVQHYAGLDPEHYFFEMLNEPPVGVLPAFADEVNMACVDTIRHYDTVHTLIVGSHTASIGSSYLTFTPYPDTNLIYTFHTYEPLYFTHQGFTWSTPQFPVGTPFPFLGDDALVTSSLDAVANWRSTYGLPVFMGEYGVGKLADPVSRCNWITHLGELIDSRGFNALAWDWGGVQPSDFSMFDTVPPSVNTMIPCFGEALHLYGFVGESELSIPSKLNVWPNPAGETLSIRSEESPIVRIEWLDMQGRMLMAEPIPVMTTTTLSLQGLPNGMLMLRLRFKNGGSKSIRIVHAGR